MATPEEQWAAGQAQWTPEPSGPTPDFIRRFGQYFEDKDIDSLWDLAVALEKKGDIKLFSDHLQKKFGLNPSEGLQEYMVGEVMKSADDSGESYAGLKNPVHHERHPTELEKYGKGFAESRLSQTLKPLPRKDKPVGRRPSAYEGTVLDPLGERIPVGHGDVSWNPATRRMEPKKYKRPVVKAAKAKMKR